jgi:hypothetical protein
MLVASRRGLQRTFNMQQHFGMGHEKVEQSTIYFWLAS